jgi:hypothetical protein
MDNPETNWNMNVSRQIISRLRRRRMEGSYSPTADQAKREVLEMIPHGATVSRCGSMTLTRMGLWEDLQQLPGVRLIDPYLPGLSAEDVMTLRRQGLTADVMLASSNAITLDGRLINLDGTGNRVAALAFGPQKVILVVGMNKVTRDLESAIARVKTLAAPLNATRYEFDNPCVKSGICNDCHGPQRVCNFWSIVEGSMLPGRIHVKLVGENLGY